MPLTCKCRRCNGTGLMKVDKAAVPIVSCLRRAGKPLTTREMFELSQDRTDIVFTTINERVRAAIKCGVVKKVASQGRQRYWLV